LLLFLPLPNLSAIVKLHRCTSLVSARGLNIWNCKSLTPSSTR